MKINTQDYPKTAGRAQINGSVVSNDGIVQGIGEEGKNFVRGYEKSVKNHRDNIEKWIKTISNLGITYAQPDDGYHHREDGYFSTSGYPHFGDKPKVGDMVALGDYEKFVVVIVKKVSGFFSKTYSYKSKIY